MALQMFPKLVCLVDKIVGNQLLQYGSQIICWTTMGQSYTLILTRVNLNSLHQDSFLLFCARIQYLVQITHIYWNLWCKWRSDITWHISMSISLLKSLCFCVCRSQVCIPWIHKCGRLPSLVLKCCKTNLGLRTQQSWTQEDSLGCEHNWIRKRIGCWFDMRNHQSFPSELRCATKS